jgi:hypothetical protein
MSDDFKLPLSVSSMSDDLKRVVQFDDVKTVVQFEIRLEDGKANAAKTKEVDRQVYLKHIQTATGSSDAKIVAPALEAIEKLLIRTRRSWPLVSESELVSLKFVGTLVSLLSPAAPPQSRAAAVSLCIVFAEDHDQLLFQNGALPLLYANWMAAVSAGESIDVKHPQANPDVAKSDVAKADVTLNLLHAFWALYNLVANHAESERWVLSQASTVELMHEMLVHCSSAHRRDHAENVADLVVGMCMVLGGAYSDNDPKENDKYPPPQELARLIVRAISYIKDTGVLKETYSRLVGRDKILERLHLCSYGGLIAKTMSLLIEYPQETEWACKLWDFLLSASHAEVPKDANSATVRPAEEMLCQGVVPLIVDTLTNRKTCQSVLVTCLQILGMLRAPHRVTVGLTDPD